MRKRTLAREIALQILYQTEMNKDTPVNDIIASYWENNQETEPEIRDFAAKIARGTVENLADIDTVLKAAADNWQLERMAVVDRNILRFATYELLYCSDIPPKVTINEAVNIAKKFSQEESGKFVNGILDKISHTEKPRTSPSDVQP